LAHGGLAGAAGRSISTRLVCAKEQNLAWGDAETAAAQLS